MPIDRRAQRLLRMLAATSAAPDTRSSVADRRAALVELAAMADDTSILTRIEDREIPGPAGAIPIRLYAPLAQPSGLSAGLVFFHGGGWTAGGLATHDGLCRRLCDGAGCRVFAVDYRLAPEHPFPAGLMDCLMAVNWVSHHAVALRIDPARIAVAGDSAGGGLAAAVTQIARDAGGPRIALQALICPILDVGRRIGSRATFAEGYFIDRGAFERDLADYVGDRIGVDDPRVSPLWASGLAGLPQALIHTAEFDPFRDEGEAYAEALALAGVEQTTIRHPGMIHYFYALARTIPYAEAAAAVIGGQIRMAFERTEPFEPAAALAS
jgi:acetyl esterase/lipase